jgi:hypothetical protein
MPDRPVRIVAEQHAAVVVRTPVELREAPFHMQPEIAELTIESQPLVATVAVAHDRLRRRIDVPLRNVADRVRRRNGNPRPLGLVVPGNQIYRLRARHGSEGSHRVNGETAPRQPPPIRHLQLLPSGFELSHSL